MIQFLKDLLGTTYDANRSIVYDQTLFLTRILIVLALYWVIMITYAFMSVKF